MKSITALLILFTTISLNAQVTYNELAPIIVTATRSPVEKHTITRNVIVITKEEIKKGGFENLDELLNSVGVVDVQSRYQDVQSDISIRGSNFEQTLIMIDGVPVNNPQTAHHNMNLPLTLNDIERIEIMPGHSSSLYGSYGFSGTVNIITKSIEPKNVRLALDYGSFNTYSFSDSGNFSFKNLYLSYSYIRTESDGFRYGTEYAITKLNSSVFYSIKENQGIKLYYGYTKKDFGAYDFYTPGKNLPSKEKIYNHFAYIRFNRILSSLYFDTRIYFNKAYDDFILTREDPEYYHNTHYVYRYGVDSAWGINIKKNIQLTLILNRNIEEIDSSNLGNHSRKSFGIGEELLFNFRDWGVNLSSRLDWYDDNEKYYSPGIGLYYWLSKSTILRASSGFSYRVPSFTELYYKSPVNVGDENLKAGKNYSYEIGIDWFGKIFVIRNTLFLRDEFDTIDWVEIKPKTWYAQNIDRIKFYGAENEIVFVIKKDMKLALRNQYIRTESDINYNLKYGFKETKFQSSLSFYFPLIYRINTGINIIYKFKDSESHTITSLYFNKPITKNIGIYFKGKNIFDERYEEIKGVPQPGRELKAGLEVKL